MSLTKIKNPDISGSLASDVSRFSKEDPDSPDVKAGQEAANGSALPGPEEVKVPDGGWGWFVCAASFLAVGWTCGLTNVYGIVFVELLDEFGADKNSQLYYKLAWIGSLQIASMLFMSMFASVLVDQFGIPLVSGVGTGLSMIGLLASSFVHRYEVLYLTYGVMFGTGAALCLTPSLAILNHYFDKRLAFVNGIVCVGSAVITTMFGAVLPALLNGVGLRNTMRVLCGMCAVLLICPFVWKPLRPRGKEALAESAVSKPSGRCQWLQKFKGLFNTDIFKNKDFLVWVCAVPFGFGCDYIVLIHMVNHAKENFPGHNQDVLIICFGAVSGISRVVAGRLGDVPGINRVWIQECSFMLMGLNATVFPFVKHFWLIAVLAGVEGLVDGCLICPLGPMCYDLLGPTGVVQGLGVTFVMVGIPSMGTPALAGFIRSASGSYKIAFLVAGTIAMTGANLYFLMPSNLFDQTKEKSPKDSSKCDIEEDPLQLDGLPKYRIRSDTRGSIASFISGKSALEMKNK